MRTVRRLVKKWEADGLAALQTTRRADKGKHRIDTKWQKFIINTYREGNEGSKRITPQQVAIRVQAKASELGDENFPSYRTVYRVLQPIIEEKEQKASVRNRGWRGSRLSLKTRDGLDLSVEYSNHIWQCDHTRADLLLVDQHGELLGRPWLTTVIDTYSRCIVGINLGYDAPSSQVVALALRHAILPKKYRAEYGIHEEWQLKVTQECDRHKLSLLSECPNCGARFKVPALWVDGWCPRCFMTFGDMAQCQKHYSTSGGYEVHLVEEIGAPISLDSLNVGYSYAVWIGSDSPKSGAELAQMAQDDMDGLITSLREWEPSGNLREKSRNDLAWDLAEQVITPNPESFVSQIERFRELDLVFMIWLLRGLKKTLENSPGEQPAFSWQPVVNLCIWMQENLHDISNNCTSNGYYDWSRICDAIIELIEAGLSAKESNKIPSTLRNQVWQLLEPLTNDPQVTPGFTVVTFN